MHRVGTVVVLLALSMADPAVAQNEAVGRVKTATGTVVVIRDGAREAAKPGDPVEPKDVFETGADGAIGITLSDNTVLSAGPNSQLALEEYSFDSSNFKGSMIADLRKGTLAVVSGDIARSSPDAMKVRMPTAMLGVRGTQFAVQVR